MKLERLKRLFFIYFRTRLLYVLLLVSSCTLNGPTGGYSAGAETRGVIPAALISPSTAPPGGR